MARLLGLNLVPETEWAVHQARLGTAMAMAGGKAPSSKGPFALALGSETVAALKKREGALPALAKKFRSCSVEWSQTAENTLVFDQYRIDSEFDDCGSRKLDIDGTPKTLIRREQVWVSQDFGHPALRRDLIRLQWLDHLTGQVDRNPMNYLVDTSQDGGVSISAIDNDLSFPAVPQVPEPLGNNMIWLPALPNLVDDDLAKAILAVKEDEWVKCLTGLFMPNELQYACARLQVVQNKVKQLTSDGCVVPVGDDVWASPKLSEMLGVADLEQRVQAATNDNELWELWVSGCQHSYLQRDAVKQAMVLSGREPMAYFDRVAIQAFIRDELLKG